MESIFTIEYNDIDRTVAARTASAALHYLTFDDPEDFSGVTEANITGREEVPGWDEFFATYHPLNPDTMRPAEAKTGKAYLAVEGRALPKTGNFWTLIQDDEDGLLWIVPGVRFANRLGYFLTEAPAKDESEQFLF